MTTWFNQWSECEQTVALYSLIRQLSVLQARFVEHLLQEQASSDTEVDHAEHAANSLGEEVRENLNLRLVFLAYCIGRLLCSRLIYAVFSVEPAI